MTSDLTSLNSLSLQLLVNDEGNIQSSFKLKKYFSIKLNDRFCVFLQLEISPKQTRSVVPAQEQKPFQHDSDYMLCNM